MGNPFQWSCLGNPMDREAWWATVHEVANLNMTWRLDNKSVVYVTDFVFFSLLNTKMTFVHPLDIS